MTDDTNNGCADATIVDTAERLRHVAEGKFDSMSLDLLREAADEIERLWNELADWQRTVRAQDAEIERLSVLVGDLLTPAMDDAHLGASIGPCTNDQCNDDCENCQWYESSVALLARIAVGEFN